MKYKFSTCILSLIPHFQNRGIAQLVEWRSPKPQAAGSSPAAPAKIKK